MKQPLVSVIVPTTLARNEFNASMRRMFAAQDYPNKVLHIRYGPSTIGDKRNKLCEAATGEIIVHFDSDDFYAPDWISKSVEALLTTGADIVGLTALNFYDLDNHAAYRYQYDLSPGYVMWLAGATLCYRKSFWEQNKFPDMQVSEDAVFVSRAKSIYPHGNIDSFLATIHGGNTSPRNTNDGNWRRLVGEEEKGIKDRWKL